MTRPIDPLFDQRIADWLDADPDRAPREVLDSVLVALPSISQKVPLRAPLELRRQTVPAAAAIAAVVVALVAGALMLRPDRAIVAGPSASPTATHDASRSASPMPSPSVPTVPLVKGSWMPAANMTTEHVFHTATLLADGTVLLTGSAQVGPSAVLYDPATRSFSATGTMRLGRTDQTATLLADGRVLVAGGSIDVDDGSKPTPSAELYDPRTRTWAATGSMHTARSGHTATLLADGRVLVTAGLAGDTVTSTGTASSELYDPATGTWSPAADIPQARVYHTATLLGDGRVLVAGGWYGVGVSAEIYDPATDIWADTGYMRDARFGHTATLLPDGRVLVAGGRQTIDLTKWAASAEVYDPATGSWTPTGSMALHRADNTATLLDDGTVLVAGGGNLDDGTEQQFAERYDPASGTWTSTADMTTFRVSHTATLLPDGTVLVTGGRSRVRGLWTSYRSTEIYDPFATNGRTP